MKKNRSFPNSIVLTILFIVVSFILLNSCKTGQGGRRDKVPEIILISPEEAYEIISGNDDVVILDVRTPEEFKEGHLKNAWSIPVDDLEGRISALQKDVPVIVYCQSGVRSNRAAGILIKNKFSVVYDMGGIRGWEEEGYPVVAEYNNNEDILEIITITVDEAYDIYLSSEDHIFLDVRSEDEYNNSHIKGAINIPVSEIEDRLEEIQSNKRIIVYCNGSGCNRSGMAAKILVQNGFDNVFDMIGRGIFEWEEKEYPLEEE